MNDLIEQFANLISELRSDKYNVVSIKYGKKYAKILKGTSTHAFVDLLTLNVYKPASYSAPAKGSRGNLYNWQTYKLPRYAGLSSDGFVLYNR